MDFPEKVLFTLKLAKKTQNKVFLSFHKCYIRYCWKKPKMKDLTIYCFHEQTPLILGKFSFTSYTPKNSFPIRLQDSFIINITGRIASLSLIFCISIFTIERQHLRLLILVGCVQAFTATVCYYHVTYETCHVRMLLSCQQRDSNP